MPESSLIKGTLTAKDAFIRFELPRLESDVKNILNQVNTGITRLNNYLENGITVNAQGNRHEFSQDQIKKIIPDQLKELHTVKIELETALKKIGYENPQAANQVTTVAGSIVNTATTEQSGQDPIKTTTITPVSPKGKKA